MGYHVKPKDKTVLIYSRDALAAGLQVLTNIITSIQDRKFRPDAPRNQRFVDMVPMEVSEQAEIGPEEEINEPLMPEAKERWQMHEIPTPERSSHRLVEAEQSSSDEAESTQEGAESEDDRNMEAVMTSRLRPPKKSIADLYRHGITGTVHRGSTVEGRLARGRPISGVTIKLEEEIYALGNRCKVCEGYPK